MKKRTLRQRIRYWFDRMMSGPASMALLLLAATVLSVSIIGVLAYFAAGDGSSVLSQIWTSLMYTLDEGSLAETSTDNIWYLLVMSLATVCGLFLTSILIGIIATAVEDKLGDLRKGTSVVQEDDHTVIIGFDNNIYAILRELVAANANQKAACVVVLGEQPKQEMEDAIASHIPDTKTTRIICRSGNLHESYALERCAVEDSKSVILNVHEDAETVKILLALSAYVKDKKLRNERLRFVATLEDGAFQEAAKIAGEERARIIHTKDAIARIIANTCRQHGLSQVLTELFNFSGHELYLEQVPELAGKTLREAALSFSNAVPVGAVVKGEVKLNPTMDTVIDKDGQLVLLEQDDGSFEYHKAATTDESVICNGVGTNAQASDHLIVLGSNEKLPIILAEYEKYVKPGTCVLIVDDDLDETKLGTYEKLQIRVCTETVTRQLLCEFIDDDANNILLLNDDSRDPETSDSQTLLRLILLRDIADKTNRHFSITTEMRSVENQRLAAQARVDDFVIGSNFASLMMAQISENPQLHPLIQDLLDEDGSELYMKPVTDYVATGVPVSGYTLAESAARKGEVYIGYRHMHESKTPVVINPNKEETVVFGEKDQVIVIAER